MKLNYQIAFGFLCIFFLIIIPISLSATSVCIPITDGLDLSTIANIFVAIGTMILAIVTFFSVKASEKQVEILNNTFLLSQKHFSKDLILDHMKTLFHPLNFEIEREILFVQKKDICDNHFRFFGLIKDKMNIKCLDLASINTFLNTKNEPKLIPHLIYLKENNPELLDLLKRRQGYITSCKLLFGSMRKEIHKNDEKNEAIILKSSDIHPFEEETGWDSSILVDYVILHQKPDEGSGSDLPVPIHEFQRSLYSLFLSDILNPINDEKFPFDYDFNYEYNCLKEELLKNIGAIKIAKFRQDVDEICKKISETDCLILENITKVKEEFIKSYHISSGELS